MARKKMKGWQLNGDIKTRYASAWTKSEARAAFKAQLGIHAKERLPHYLSVTQVQGV